MATQAVLPNGNGNHGVIPSDFSWAQDEEYKSAIRDVYAKGASDAQFRVFLKECELRKLMPGKQLHFRLQRSKEKEWDPQLREMVEKWVEKPIFITAIDTFRLIAQRTGQYGGQKRPAWIYLDKENQPTVRREIPDPSMQPFAAEATVIRKDFVEPLTRIARWGAFAQTYRQKGGPDNGKPIPTQMWEKMGPEQLFKCAEAQALRAAFPEELGGMYVAEEFSNQDEPEREPLPALLTAPLAALPEEVEQPKMNQELGKTFSEQEPKVQIPAAPVIDLPATSSQQSAAAGPPLSPANEAAAPSPQPKAEEKKVVTAEDVQKKFGGTLKELKRPETEVGAKGFTWYLRNVFDPNRVPKAGTQLQLFVLQSSGVANIKEVTEARKAALLELMDKTLSKGGTAAVIKLVCGEPKK